MAQGRSPGVTPCPPGLGRGAGSLIGQVNNNNEGFTGLLKVGWPLRDPLPSDEEGPVNVGMGGVQQYLIPERDTPSFDRSRAYGLSQKAQPLTRLTPSPDRPSPGQWAFSPCISLHSSPWRSRLSGAPTSAVARTPRRPQTCQGGLRFLHERQGPRVYLLRFMREGTILNELLVGGGIHPGASYALTMHFIAIDHSRTLVHPAPCPRHLRRSRD